MEKFKTGYFGNYKTTNNLSESLKHSFSLDVKDSKKINVFISHKHSDLEDLKGLIGFLEKDYGCNCYIDSNDSLMPSSTCGETANRIKNKIKNCDIFILLATPGAIASKWCNWELGYGDAYKNNENKLALLFIYSNSEDYGNEYMQIYPHIVYRNGNEKYSNGNPIPKGFYLKYSKGDEWYLISLKKWFENNHHK